MKQYTLYNDNAPDIRFTGEKLAEVSTKSINDTRWDILKLFKTVSGRFICGRIQCSEWMNEKTVYEVCIAENEKEVIRFFGYTDDAKYLYKQASIGAVMNVD